VGEPTRTQSPPLSLYFLGVLTPSRQLVTIPRLTSADAPTPELDDGALLALQDGRTITVPSDDDAVD
jgi:hypothetical protein